MRSSSFSNSTTKACVIPFYKKKKKGLVSPDGDNFFFLKKARGQEYNDLKTFRTVISATYDGLDVGVICSGMYASRL